MVRQNQTFVKGVFINRPPPFVGENYRLWKVRMQFVLDSICWKRVAKWLVFGQKSKGGMNWF